MEIFSVTAGMEATSTAGPHAGRSLLSLQVRSHGNERLGVMITITAGMDTSLLFVKNDHCRQGIDGSTLWEIQRMFLVRAEEIPLLLSMIARARWRVSSLLQHVSLLVFD